MWRLVTFLVGICAALAVLTAVLVQGSPGPAQAGEDDEFELLCEFVLLTSNGHPDELTGEDILLLLTLGVPVGDIVSFIVETSGGNSQNFEENFIPVSGTRQGNGIAMASGTGTYRGFPTSASLQGILIKNPNGQPISFFGGYHVGESGGLPGNMPISWNVTCNVKIAITPTPDVTPPPDDFSITVISMNTITGGPIPDVDFELYNGAKCEGKPIASGTADENGIHDFVGIPPQQYSVRQMTPPGYEEADEGECQEVNPQQSARVGSQGLPDCPINPDAEFPAPGCDSFDSGAQVNIEIKGGSRFTVTLNGPTLVARHSSPADTDSDGLDQVETEIVAMELTGDSVLAPITVVQSVTRPSEGQFEEVEDGGPQPRVGSQALGVMDFPAVSTFGIFVEVQAGGMSLHNKIPIPMQCIINEIPPILCLYQPPLPGPIPLYQADDTLWGYIIHSLHIPLPDGEVLVVFNNVPFVGFLWGDIDCDGDVDIIDGLALVRFVAGLPVPPPPIHEPCFTLGGPVKARAVSGQGLVLIWGDVDCDGDVDVIDGLALARFVAGLPVPPPPIAKGCPPIGAAF